MTNIDPQDIRKLMEDVALIKKVLSINKEDPEGGLTEWAKNQLKIARIAPHSDYVSHEEVKQKILSKK